MRKNVQKLPTKERQLICKRESLTLLQRSKRKQKVYRVTQMLFKHLLHHQNSLFDQKLFRPKLLKVSGIVLHHPGHSGVFGHIINVCQKPGKKKEKQSAERRFDDDDDGFLIIFISPNFSIGLSTTEQNTIERENISCRATFSFHP